ncbi:MAG: hypothetical protein A2W26_09560 [Acidobacteria bacterium RBG_16_64_8]|nr:MAG: hypothetical protein A2W26_09560 [Acidobacteria bacterium RBG_16_64_8]
MTRRDLVVTGGTGIAGLVVGGLIGYAVAPNESTSQTQTGAKEPIHIGAAYPLTGPIAGDGVDARRGAEMAVAEINASGGVLGRQVILDVEDIEDLAPDKVTTAFSRLINEKNGKALFMAYADVAMAEFPEIAKSGLPFFHVNTVKISSDWVVENKSTNIFQWDSHELPYGSGLANFLARLEAEGKWKPKEKTVAIVGTNNPYAVNIAKAFQEAAKPAGWKTILYEKVNPPLSEWGPVLAKIRQNPPDLIMQLDYYMADLASFTKQFVAAPTQSLLYEQYGPSVPAFMDLVKDAGNGVIWSTVIGWLPDKIGNDWHARFVAKYNTEPSVSNAADQYDAIMAWRESASVVGDPEDSAKINEVIKNIRYRGVCGAYSLDPTTLTAFSFPGTGDQETMDGSLGLPNLMFQIQNQKQVLVSPDPFTQGTFQTPPWLK